MLLSLLIQFFACESCLLSPQFAIPVLDLTVLVGYIGETSVVVGGFNVIGTVMGIGIVGTVMGIGAVGMAMEIGAMGMAMEIEVWGWGMSLSLSLSLQ